MNYIQLNEHRKIEKKKKIKRAVLMRKIMFFLFVAVIITFIVLFSVAIVNAIGTNNQPEEQLYMNDITTNENDSIDSIINDSLPETTATTSCEPTTERTEKYISLGEYRLTAYCSCEKCCGYWATIRPTDSDGNQIVYTASGAKAVCGITIAADTNVLPFGTKVYINGHEYIVQDRGGAIKGNRIDVYFADHQEALNFGVQYAEVFIMEEAENG